jgi:hypothetical protein
VTYPAKHDRREHPRFPQVLEAHAQALLPLPPGHSTLKEFTGRIQNVSEGGICLMTSKPLPVPCFVCCRIVMLEVPAAIPTLLQLRWTAKSGNKNPRYICGFRFVGD